MSCRRKLKSENFQASLKNDVKPLKTFPLVLNFETTKFDDRKLKLVMS